uniref:Uncharacterized protein n=1 Tax=Panagrolaimus sp. ES5 TaxID=591445 RepID=A0AC34FVG3_9BILA
MASLHERRSMFSKPRKRNAGGNTEDADDTFQHEFQDNCDNYDYEIQSDYGSIIPPKVSKFEPKLYASSEHSVDDFNKSFIFLCRKANVTDATADKFLHLFKVFLPRGNKCPGNFRTLRNYFDNILPASNEPEEISYCKKCCSLLTPTGGCMCDKNQIKQTGLLQVYSIKPQIEAIIEKHEQAIIEYRTQLRAYPEGYYMDSQNGSILAAIKEPIFALNFYIIQLQGDMPAKAKIGNYKGGGYYICVRCDIRGNKKDKIIQFNSRDFQLTTPETYREELKKVIRSEEESCIKGPSAFAEIMKFPTCITGDVMHSVYYGPPREDLLEILKVKAIRSAFDDTIKNIKLPVELSNRNLRVTSESAHFKASEWKAILFYVVPVVLPPFLIDKNLTGKKSEKIKSQIFNLLECVAAMACLMQDVVKEESIQHSQNLLDTWFDERDGLFKHNVYVPKTHDIMHFPNQVRLHGPLQCSSCFGGENVLQTLSNMVTCKVPRTIITQLSQRLSYLNVLNKWRTQQKHGQLKQLLNLIEKKNEETEEEVAIPNEILIEIFGEENIQIQKPIGLKLYENSGYIYHPTSSKRKKNNDSVCYFKDANGSFKIGKIHYFFKNKDNLIFAHIQPLTIKPMYKKFSEEDLLGNSNSFLFYGMVDQSKSHQTVTVNANNIVKKAFFIVSSKKTYVVPILHVFEHN